MKVRSHVPPIVSPPLVFFQKKYLSGYLDEELNSIETTSVCVVVFDGSERVQRAARADEGALDADGAPDAGSARVKMADRAAGGALGADGAQDSGADKV
jgi:hypothetical protein